MTASGATRHIGLDLGGTNLKWVVVERAGDDWTTIDRGQVPTDRGGPPTIVPQLGEVARGAIAAAGGAATVGVGLPGLYLPDGNALFLPNVPGEWAGIPVAGPVAAATGLPASLINDARAFGLAELRLGAGRGARTMVGLTLGTGVGGCICIDGRLFIGHHDTGGELGHTTIEPDGPWCTCGNRGCIEAFARADQVARLCGTPTAEEAMERAAAGDPAAIAGFAEVGRYLGIAISNFIIALTPDAVILGGGVSAAGELLLTPIRAEVRRRVRVTDLDRIRFAVAELGTWAGAIGAAVHAAEQLEAAVAGR
jgi:glucokinase